MKAFPDQTEVSLGCQSPEIVTSDKMQQYVKNMQKIRYVEM